MMKTEPIKPVKAKKNTKDCSYTLEDFQSSYPDLIQRTCPCGSNLFLVYSNYEGYETWVECPKCGNKTVVHDG